MKNGGTEYEGTEKVSSGHALVFYRDYLIDPIRSLKLIILLPLLS